MANKVINPGFETDIGALTGWSTWCNVTPTPAGNTFLASELAPHAGVQCAKADKTVDCSTFELYRWILSTDANGTIEAGHRYTVSAWIKISDGASVKAGSVNLRLQAYDASNAVITTLNDERAYFHYNDVDTHTHDWVQISYVTQPMPTGTANGLVELFLSGDFAGTVFWDDVSVEELAEPQYALNVTYPTTKNRWYPSLHSSQIIVSGKIIACDSSPALNALESYAVIKNSLDATIQTTATTDVPASGIITHTFDDADIFANAGEYSVEVVIATKADHVAVVTQTGIPVWVYGDLEPVPTTYFDTNGHLVDNGVTKFAIQAYCGTTSNLSDIAAMGIDYIIPYGVPYLPSTPDSSYETFINAVGANGLKAFVMLHYFAYGKYPADYETFITDATDKVDAIHKVVDAYKDNSSVIGYEFGDDLYNFNLTQFNRVMEYVRDNDKDGLMFTDSSVLSDHSQMNDTFDIGTIHYYPCNYELQGKTLSIEIAKFNTGLARFATLTIGKPFMPIIEGSQYVNSGTHPLTLQMLMLEAVMAIVNGATGLTYWRLDGTEYDSNVRVSLATVIAKLKNLESVLVSTVVTGASAATISDSGLISRSFTYDGKVYCFVANYTPDSITTDVTFPSAVTQIKSDNMIGANTVKTATANAISETIEGYGSRLYSVYAEDTGGGGAFTWDANGDAQTVNITSSSEYTITRGNIANIYNGTDKTVTVVFNLLDGETVIPIKTVVLTTLTGKSVQIKGLFTTGTLRMIATPAAACSGTLTVNIY